ncbi:MAG: VOC family protein, partial [Chloroflexota bacterium]|nr:VOC family protein [Chloroflexota bacterium]
RWVEAILGVPMQPGGEHRGMGTHNALLALGDRRYLEVIAPNPNAPPSERLRQFGLAELPRDAEPRLATWVARTDDIDAAAAAAAAGSGALLGDIYAMSRGAYAWRITVPGDGGLLSNGLVPAVIQWRGDDHPGDHLDDRGCRLVRLDALSGAPRALATTLAALGLDRDVTVSALREPGASALVATIASPNGVTTIGSA